MHDPYLDYNVINDYIIVGKSMCCWEHRDYYFNTLKKLEVYADIDLRAEISEPCRNLSAHLWLPVLDTFAPTFTQAKIGVSFIKQIVDASKKMYVHCQAGQGRAPTLVIAYFVLEKGMSVNDASAVLKEKRPTIKLQEAQLEFLKSLKYA